MTLPFLISIDLPSPDTSPSQGLSLKEVFYFGRVLAKVKNESLGEAHRFLRENFSLLSIYLDVTDVEDVDEVVELLNEGATKVFVNFEQLKLLTREPSISLDRLVLSTSRGSHAESLKQWITEFPERKELAWILAHSPIDESTDVDKFFGENVVPGFESTSNTIYLRIKSTTDFTVMFEKKDVVTVISPRGLTLDTSNDREEIVSAAELLSAAAVPDKSTGLYATTVTDERGIALGLVWSSKESISEALRTGTGVYQSRKRGLWYKGASSGDTQELVRIDLDCDRDCLRFVVRQKGKGFCHLGNASCFGPAAGLSRLEKTLQSRKADAPPGSYTARLFKDPKLVQAKIMEETEELCQASTKEDIAAEAADLFYFTLTKCVAAGVSLEDVEKNLDLKSLKVKRRKGDAKGQWAEKAGSVAPKNGTNAINGVSIESELEDTIKSAASVPKIEDDTSGLMNGRIEMKRYTTEKSSAKALKEALQRPSQRSNETIMGLVIPIIKDVRETGDSAVLKYTHKFEKATSLTSPVLHAPFPERLMQLPKETIEAINVSFNNIERFHVAQKEEKPLMVETMPGVICSRFSRPIERVGLYVPGGTAVLPSTALMLGVPARAAGCKTIVLATPPRADGTITPEIVYIAHKIGAESIVLAGGAQAVAAMAYGTQSISKVDKILGPGNQFVTAAKMIVSNDTTAGVSIDMPAGPSEVLVIADKTANPAFVASDLLSQAEHGTDSQVILIAIDLNEKQLAAIEDELHAQANALPRVDIVRGAIDHSVTIVVKDVREAMEWSNFYAPEHLILQIENAADIVPMVQNAGSVFVGAWTPESVGDYSTGVNHSLPTYGYARQYSGVNLGSFTKHITSSNLTKEGLRNLAGAVMQLANVEGLDAHARAVGIRMEAMERDGK